MTKEDVVSGVLNEVLTFVVTGIDYASEIARETGKSIPVVFRQLDQLLDMDFITKEREGKKVIYKTNWDKISTELSKELIKDIGAYSEYLKNVHPRSSDSELDKELKALLTELPKDIMFSDHEVQKIVSEMFEEHGVQLIFKDFIDHIGRASTKILNMAGVTFNTTLDYFLDAIGVLSPEEQKEILKNRIKIKNGNDLVLFMRLCRIRYLQKSMTDPVRNFFNNRNK
ncbi:helix-turn-helix domain-containing protein [Candidatus Woesearchaeota archaeon]|nr:helix-turn-helix domain-containing protein [Candidatus Woesearchaeota archaeon]